LGLGKGRKVPQSVKTRRKIDAAVDEALKQQSHAYIHSKELDQAQIEQLKKQLTDAIKQPVRSSQTMQSVFLMRLSTQVY
jgi:hypothetical protein